MTAIAWRSLWRTASGGVSGESSRQNATLFLPALIGSRRLGAKQMALKISPARFACLQIPHGIMFGTLGVAVPLLLSRLGWSVDKAAFFVALTLSPPGWAFLLTPLLDARPRRRRISAFLGGAGALAVGLAIPALMDGNGAIAGGLFLFAETAILLFTASVSSLVCRVAPESEWNQVGGWGSAGVLLGLVASGTLVPSLASRMGATATGAGLALGLAVMIGYVLCLPLFGEGSGADRKLPIRPRLVLEDRRFLRCCAFLFLPVASGGILEVIPGIAPLYGWSDQDAVAGLGGMVPILNAAGALAGGIMLSPVPPLLRYGVVGLVLGGLSGGMVMLPHSRYLLLGYLGLYAFVMGAGISAMSAILLGFGAAKDPLVSFRISVGYACGTWSTVLMTALQGTMFQRRGTVGLFSTDALFSVAGGMAVLLMETYRPGCRQHTAGQHPPFRGDGHGGQAGGLETAES